MLTTCSAIVCDNGIEVVSRVGVHWVARVHVVLGEVEIGEGEGNMATDLGGEVGIKAKSFEVDAEHFWKPYNAHLLQAVLKAAWGEGI